jgi:hypothetical protein
VSFVVRLRQEMSARLDELDAERSRLLAAVEALEGSPAATPESRQSRDTRRVLAEVRAAPGVRSSVIAMSLGLSSTSVAAVLHDLESRGEAMRSGLGWRLPD